MSNPSLADLPLATLLKDLHNSQVERRRDQKRLDLMEEKEKTLAMEILKREKASFTSGSYVVDITTDTEVPNATDWTKIIEYIKETGSVDLLEKRLLKSGVKQRWADGNAIPGVDKATKTTLKIEVL